MQCSIQVLFQGQTLSSPGISLHSIVVESPVTHANLTATYKYTNTGEDERYIYVVSEMQGWRICELFSLTALWLRQAGLCGPGIHT